MIIYEPYEKVIKTANNHKNIKSTLKAYTDDYAKSNQKFQGELVIEAYRKYLK